MDFSDLDKKLHFYMQHKSMIPEGVIDNYDAVFSIDYTHNSTAIEGNTLSLIETKLLLEDGVSPNGKNMREIYEVVNHNKAYKYVIECVSDNVRLNKDIVKNIHEILMENIMIGGIYRTTNVYITGARHTPPSPDDAYRQLELFYYDIDINKDKMHPIQYAAWTHAEFVKIHPFTDGNGRTSRLLMNYQLIAAGYLPISIKAENRLKYFETLEAFACDNDLSPFSMLISELEQARLDIYITAINQIMATQ